MTPADASRWSPAQRTIPRMLALGLGLSLLPGQLAWTGQTTVTLPTSATTSAGVFDQDGRLVRTLWRGESQPAGHLVLDWDGKDDDGKPVPPGGQFSVRV